MVAYTTKVPKRTVERINKELHETENRSDVDCSATNEDLEKENDHHAEPQEISTTKKKRRVFLSTLRKNPKTSKKQPVTGLDNFQLSAICHHVLQYYERRGVPIVKNLLVSLKEKGHLNNSPSSLRKI